MKLDKETILKHHFWALLVVAFALVFSALGVMYVSASSAGEAKRKEFEDAKKAASDARGKRPKNQKFNKPWEDYMLFFRGAKDRVWQQAWLLQKDMITWPSSNDSPFQRVWDQSQSLGEFFKRVSEENPGGWRSSLARREFKESLYPSQFRDLEKLVVPVELRGGVDGVFQPNRFEVAPPTVEELWLAQEDFWVRRELLGVVRAVLDSVARFERVPLEEGEAKPADVRARHRFRNSHWELDLLVEQRDRQQIISSRSKIKNVHVSKRAQNLANPKTGRGSQFRLIQGPSTVTLRVEGEPLAWGQSTELRKATAIDTIDLTRPFDVEQVFEWTAAPVRRIDALVPAYHSHRTAHRALQKNAGLEQFFPREEGAGGPGAANLAKGPGGPAAAAGGPAGGPAAATGPAIAGMEDAGGAGDPNITPNGFSRDRYLHITEQCRHMPVAMLLVVDQSHVHDVLIAFANSRLRVQTTQFHFQHIRGIQPPHNEEEAAALAAAGGAAGDRPGVGFPMRPAVGTPKVPAAATPFPPMGKGGPKARPFIPGAGPGGMPGSGGSPYDDGDDPNLVELAVYGIATLYERFPVNRLSTDGPGAAPGSAPPAAPMTPMAPMPMPMPGAGPMPKSPAAPAPAPGTPAPAPGAPAAPAPAPGTPAPTTTPKSPPPAKQ